MGALEGPEVSFDGVGRSRFYFLREGKMFWLWRGAAGYWEYLSTLSGRQVSRSLALPIPSVAILNRWAAARWRLGECGLWLVWRGQSFTSSKTLLSDRKEAVVTRAIPPLRQHSFDGR